MVKQIRVEGGGQAPKRQTEAEKLEEMNYKYTCAKRDGKKFNIPKGYRVNDFDVIVPVKKQGASTKTKNTGSTFGYGFKGKNSPNYDSYLMKQLGNQDYK
jgi:hypothetical protein